KGCNQSFFIFFQYAKLWCFTVPNGNGGNGYISFHLFMVIQHLLEIHLVKLVTGKNKYIVAFKWCDMPQALPYRISCSLVPGWVIRSLFCSKYVNESRTEGTEMIGVLDMPVERCGIKLG